MGGTVQAVANLPMKPSAAQNYCYHLSLERAHQLTWWNGLLVGGEKLSCMEIWECYAMARLKMSILIFSRHWCYSRMLWQLSWKCLASRCLTSGLFGLKNKMFQLFLLVSHQFHYTWLQWNWIKDIFQISYTEAFQSFYPNSLLTTLLTSRQQIMAVTMINMRF